MEKCDGIKSEQYEIDPKAIAKEQLYGILDPTTLEWTDGVFTATLRMIIDNVRGESNKRHWIVLDDNKMLTLPNGERLALTPNIRIIFETPTLFYVVWHGLVKNVLQHQCYLIIKLIYYVQVL